MGKKHRVAVGISGGVDSSVAAYLLKEQGFDVTGVTVLVWREDGPPESSASGLSEARSAAEALDIPHTIVDFEQIFKEKVINNFVREYTRARTPNPCVVCNRWVKWEALLGAARGLGADFIATGHYARVEKHPRTGRMAIRAAATEKDQSYALYALTQEQLAHTLTPLGALSKPQVRAIAKEIGLKNAGKPDSQEICFIPHGGYAAFIAEYAARAGNPADSFAGGDFIDTAGNVIGRHSGLPYYTIGQRKGLGAFGGRVYVKAMDPDRNTVTLAEDAELFQSALRAEDVCFMAYTAAEIAGGVRASAKIRYGHRGAPCTARFADGALSIEFDSPQRAVTPGQAAVVYGDGFVLCGGTII